MFSQSDEKSNILWKDGNQTFNEGTYREYFYCEWVKEFIKNQAPFGTWLRLV